MKVKYDAILDALREADTAVLSGGFVGGSGTVNYLTKWTPDGVTVGVSQVFDNGSFVGINITTQLGSSRLTVNGSISAGGYLIGANIFAGHGTAGTSITNTLLGVSAGPSLNATSGADLNTFVGYRAGFSVVAGVGNTIIGADAAIGLTGSGNTIIGSSVSVAAGLTNSIVLANGNGLIRLQFDVSGVLTLTLGGMTITTLPSSNAGLNTGGVYIATAAQILANGDKVLGSKV